MNNEYNLYLNSFTKEYPLIISSLILTQTRDLDFVGRWIERSSQQISSLELVRDLLSFKPFECSSSSSKTLEIEFLQSFGLLKTCSPKMIGDVLYL